MEPDSLKEKDVDNQDAVDNPDTSTEVEENKKITEPDMNNPEKNQASIEKHERLNEKCNKTSLGGKNESIIEVTESLELTETGSPSNCNNREEIPMEVDQEEVQKSVDKNTSQDSVEKEIEIEINETESESNQNKKQTISEKDIDLNEEIISDQSDNCSSKEFDSTEKDLSKNKEVLNKNIDDSFAVADSSNYQEQVSTKTRDNSELEEPSQKNFHDEISTPVDDDKKSEDEKNVENEGIVEMENTEFVQINQMREDSQSSFTRSENQLEAENDPFGDDAEPIKEDSGKSLSSYVEKVVPRELGQETKKDVSDESKKQEKEKSQCNESDEVYNIENPNASQKLTNIPEKTLATPLEKPTQTLSEKSLETPDQPVEVLSNTQEETLSNAQEGISSKTLAEISLESPEKTVSEKTIITTLEKSSENSSKKLTETSKDSSTDILPGQDDELCIVPDSSKKKSAKDQSTDVLNDEVDKDKELPISNKENNSTSESSKKTETAISQINTEFEKDNLKVAALASCTNDTVSVDKSTESSSILTSDVIDVEDDNKVSDVEEIASKEICKQCKLEKPCSVKVKIGTKNYTVCSDECKAIFTAENNKATDIPSEGVNSKREKRCANCLLIVEVKDEKNLSWETMEFCNEECLGKFQTKYGSYCRNCNGAVQPVSLGKYCVRFGYDVRQFCCSTCLEEFKKGLKVCSYCQKDISAGTEGFLAPVGDKGQFKDFCTQDCMEKYSKMNSTDPPLPEKKICSVCQEEKVMHCEVQIERNPSVPICSEPCFAAFKFVNKVDPDQCSTCKKYFQLPTKKGFVVFYEAEAHTFCNKTCLNVFIIQNRKIVPCNWCKVKKYNFDMIKKELKTGQVMMMCSLNCLTLYQVSINAVSARRINCDFCKEYSQAQYHLTMSDATIRNFCSYACVMKFQAQYTKSPITIPTSDTGAVVSTDPVPTGIPKRAVAPTSIGMPQISRPSLSQDLTAKKTMPVISSVTSLAASIANGQPGTVQIGSTQASIGGTLQPITLQGTAPVIYKQQIVTRPTSPVSQGNKMTQCKPMTHTKGVSVRPIPCHRETQTEVEDKLIVPLPVPIFIPFPVHMYSMPFPVPVPIPIPIPVPIFIPTTRNSAKSIFKDIKRIQEKIPSDPFEAELLMMAEMVATDKKNESNSDSNDETREDGGANDSVAGESYSPEGVDTTNAFGEDMLQMALKMATGEIDEPAVDLETELTPSTIQTPHKSGQDENIENDAPKEKSQSARGRKRGGFINKSRSGPNKRPRRSISANNNTMLTSAENQNTVQNRLEPAEKPDANMALKYTFGVNAWRQWVITKNAELEKQSTPTRKLKLFKTDLLQLTADELNYSLCLFVKEVRKPSGAEYAPDTIYYLCLGIQQYLFENNRIDNIFTDAYYEKFTDCLNEVAKKFSTVFNDAVYVVTRVEEEHLWECKQLGAHSPHVLLNTLMYFNTKHFNLVTVDEHMQLSFSHIMKHWKRNQSAGLTTTTKGPGSRNIMLRFYPPQSALEANSKKKKVYEQLENEENPLRCPVKLYEFYLSKCPESVKTRNDVFYLLPERSCVPDSPVWYSTSPLAKEHLIKMLYRIKMVKEVNVAFLSS